MVAVSPKIIATPRDISSLRSTIDWLRANGDLIETQREVDPDLEITGLQKHLDGGPPILFENVKGKPHARAITNLFSNRIGGLPSTTCQRLWTTWSITSSCAFSINSTFRLT